ncbi:MAG: VanW family protein [Peptococcaceae bacterium]|nr:VanW family protein [Peptococcaceae bacterium]
MKKTLFLAVILACQLLFGVTIGATANYVVHWDKAPRDTKVWGVSLNTLTEAQAYQQLDGKLPHAVSFAKAVFPLATKISQNNLANWLQREYSPFGLSLQNLYRFMAGEAVPAQQTFLDRGEIWPQLEQLAHTLNHPATASQIAYINNKLVKKQGRSGVVVNVQASWQSLAASRGQTTVPLIVESTSSSPSYQQIAAIKDKLADYTTYFDPKDKDRTNNVRLAANALNNTLIAPNADFSFNSVVGDRTAAGGYLPAYIFSGKQVIQADGGGICQDATTIYLALRQTHLPIIERHTHSLPVYYAPPGQDATVYYGTLDLKFHNDTGNYLLLSAQTGPNWLRIRLFGVANALYPVLEKPEQYWHQQDGLK